MPGKLVAPSAATASANVELPAYDPDAEVELEDGTTHVGSITHEGEVHPAVFGTKFILGDDVYVLRAQKILAAGWHKVRTLTEAQKAKLKAGRAKKK